MKKLMAMVGCACVMVASNAMADETNLPPSTGTPEIGMGALFLGSGGVLLGLGAVGVSTRNSVNTHSWSIDVIATGSLLSVGGFGLLTWGLVKNDRYSHWMKVHHLANLEVSPGYVGWHASF